MSLQIIPYLEFLVVLSTIMLMRVNLEPRAKKSIFVGFGDGVKGYGVWSPFESRVILSRNAIFCENSMFNSNVKSVVTSTSVGE